jgi:hypothetical protein
VSISLEDFVRESNRIEGIHREPTKQEVAAHRHFLEIEGMVRPWHLRDFVLEVANAPMRLEPGMNVIVGGHRPMEGGPMVGWELDNLCDYAGTELPSPYELHVRYERLHPFMDGNGRSGRVWWLWYMERLGIYGLALPFLHRFYYQALEASRGPFQPPKGEKG